MIKKYLIVVMGPTAIGKTALSIELAKHFRTEILSCDSRQFFREMSIGTAVPSEEQRRSVPHHFIHSRSVFEPFNAGAFEKEALKKLEALYRSHNAVIMVGGSGLYIDAVVKGFDEFPEVNPDIRENFNRMYRQYGISCLQERLRACDPVYSKEVDMNNPQRLIRALEVYTATGTPFSSYKKTVDKKRCFVPLKIGLHAERQFLYKQINERVDRMMEEGLLGEVKRLYPYRHLNALQTVGYKELFEHIEGNMSLQTAVDEIKKNTRRFAKRQMTWFRKDSAINWFSISEDDPDSCIAFCEQRIAAL